MRTVATKEEHGNAVDFVECLYSVVLVPDDPDCSFAPQRSHGMSLALIGCLISLDVVCQTTRDCQTIDRFGLPVSNPPASNASVPDWRRVECVAEMECVDSIAEDCERI